MKKENFKKTSATSWIDEFGNLNMSDEELKNFNKTKTSGMVEENKEDKKGIPFGIISFISILLAYILYALLNNSVLVSILDRTATLEIIIDFFIRGALWGMGAGSIIYLVLIFIYAVFTKNCIFKEK